MVASAFASRGQPQVTLEIKLADTGGGAEIEYRLRLHNGELRKYFQSSGRSVRIVAVRSSRIVDVSDNRGQSPVVDGASAALSSKVGDAVSPQVFLSSAVE